MNKISILILIIVLLINLHIFNYINRLEKLQCSCNNSIIKFIKLFAINLKRS